MTGCEALVGVALFACLARDPACLPPEHRAHQPVLVAIAERESGFRPYALRDEATGESRFYATREEAVREAVRRDALGHVIGLGMFQITFRSNWARHFGPVAGPRVTDQIAHAYDPCANMAAGASHYAADWARAGAALQLYNSNRVDGAPAYAAGVLRRVQALAVRPSDDLAPAGARPVPSVPPKPAGAVDLLHPDEADEPPRDANDSALITEGDQP